MSVYYPNQSTGNAYFPATWAAGTTNITAISFPQIEQQVVSPPQESDLDWLRRRVNEVTELAA